MTVSKAYDGLDRDAAIAATGTQPCGLTSGYDCNGSLLNTGTVTYAYDGENRLVSASAPTSLTLTYDPLGRLTQTVSGTAGTTSFLYDGDRLSAEYSSTGALLHRYVHGPGTDEPLVWYDVHTGTAVANWLHMDRQGSVIAQSVAAGTVPQIYAYGPYGEPQAWGGSRFAYTGQIALTEAQLYHYKARAYDPNAARFLQTDPVGYKSDWDLYAYVHEDPTDNGDPTGLCQEGNGCPKPGGDEDGGEKSGNAGQEITQMALATTQGSGISPSMVANGADDIRANAAQGAQAEKAAGIDPDLPKTRVQSLTETAKYRVPDRYVKGELIEEVKSGKSLRLTNQMRDFAKLASKNGERLVYRITNGMKVTPQAAKFLQSSGAEVEYIEGGTVDLGEAAGSTAEAGSSAAEILEGTLELLGAIFF